MHMFQSAKYLTGRPCASVNQHRVTVDQQAIEEDEELSMKGVFCSFGKWVFCEWISVFSKTSESISPVLLVLITESNSVNRRESLWKLAITETSKQTKLMPGCTRVNKLAQSTIEKNLKVFHTPVAGSLQIERYASEIKFGVLFIDSFYE